MEYPQCGSSFPDKRAALASAADKAGKSLATKADLAHLQCLKSAREPHQAPPFWLYCETRCQHW
ncbi:Uncharacterised protein [Vibrio cholerae]|nr:Uncharacterised protein [Vibrio cholerae]